MSESIEYGRVPIDRALAMSGMDFLSAIRDGDLPHPPIAGAVDLRLTEVERGRVVWEGQPKQDYLNPLGGVHGGWIATLLDSCMGCAGHTMLGPGQPYTTVDLKLTYVRGVRLDGGIVRAEGKVLHAGRSLISTEGKLYDAEGKLCAHGVSALMVLAPPKS